jgi:alcohol dehydrogenase
MRIARVAEPGGKLEIVETEVPEPGRGEVRVTVEACGVCHSDAMIIAGILPGATFPAVPGHEVAGRVSALGEQVEGWQIGDRVGVGWFGGACGRCVSCREGHDIDCANLRIPGVAYPGGYADAIVVPADALAAIPAELSAVDAAPLMCAGVTVYNALRHSDARAGDVVAVLGLGGLGHLGVQYAAKFGFDTVSIARGAQKEPLARQLGARHYIDSTREDVSAALQALGGARVVLSTVTNAAATSATIDGLTARGQLVVVGADAQPLTIYPAQLLFGQRRVIGHASGTARDSEDALRFSVLTGVRPMVETVGLADAAAACERMLSGAPRFRMVLTTGN